MKISLFLLLLAVFQLQAGEGYAQKAKISIALNNATVEQILDQIEKKSEFVFLYNDKTINKNRKVSVTANSKEISQILSQVFAGTNVKYTVVDKQIILSTSQVNEPAQANQSGPQKVKGTIVDAKGEPLIGVNVLVKGTTIGVITDLDGNFELNVPENNKELSVSYIGYKTQDIHLNNKSRDLKITLLEDTKVLGEVVVTAMGIERKAESLTYATQTVGGKELTRAKDVNFVNSLQGKSAGLTITPNSSGAGGGASKIILRGQSSMLGNNQPLIVLDGIPLSNGMGGQPSDNIVMGGSDGGDMLSTINPDDIANITILKGANAAALYGSAANNGVLVITTKGGREGKVRVDVSSSTQFETPLFLPQFQTEYGGAINGYSMNYDGWGPRLSSYTPEQLARFPYATNDQSLNKLDGLYQTGMSFNNGVSISGGTEASRSYFSYANTTQRGIMENNKFSRHNLMFKQNFSLFNNKLQLDFSINYINQNLKNRPVVGKALNPIFSMYRTPASVDMRYFKKNYEHTGTMEDEMVNNINVGNRKLLGQPIQTWDWWDQYINNPYFILNRTNSEDIKDRVLTSFTAKVDIVKGLSAQARISVDQNFIKGNSSKYATINRDNRTKAGIYWVGSSWNRDIFSDYLLTYSKDFNDKVSLNVTGGTSLRRYKNGSLDIYNEIDTAAVHPNLFLPQNSKRKEESTSTTTTEKWDSNWEAAVFATAQVGFWNTAYLDLSFRNDWSKAFQQFAVGNEYKSFPYYAVGGNILLKDLIAKNWKPMNSMKLRLSYSEVGNSIPNQIYAAQDFNMSTGAITSKNAEFDDPKPETTKSVELGIDGTFLNNSLDFDLTLYQSVMSHQFLEITTSAGLKKPINSGRVRNRGIELSANYRWNINRNWSWHTGITFAYNANKILSTYTPAGGGNPDPVEIGPDLFKVKFIEGGSYGDIYMNSFARDENGNIKLDGKGTPVMTSGHDYLVGNTTAPTTFGWNNTINYKNLSFYILFDGKIGGKVISITEADLDAYGLSQRTADSRNKYPEGLQVYDAKKGTNVNVAWSDYYRMQGTTVTDAYAYDATCIRVREVSVGYTFNDVFGPSKGLSISLIGRNLGFIFKKAPVDPDLSVSAANGFSGIDVYGLPTTRTFGINLKATF